MFSEYEDSDEDGSKSGGRAQDLRKRRTRLSDRRRVQRKCTKLRVQNLNHFQNHIVREIYTYTTI